MFTVLATIDAMEIQGHYQNGMIIPHADVFLPDGTEVTIVVRSSQHSRGDAMSDDEHKRYLAALARIDAVPNENRDDNFGGIDHDRVLYGNEK